MVTLSPRKQYLPNPDQDVALTFSSNKAMKWIKLLKLRDEDFLNECL